jgi:flagellar hook protein FlgE
MSLTSVLQTALSGMTAAATTVEVVSDNLANARTPGFKAGYPAFAAQTPTTFHAGSAPTATSGGSNARQIGTGVRTIDIRTDQSWGPLVASPNSSGDVPGQSGVTELSNTDVGENIVELILAADQFTANALVFRTANDLLDQLARLNRRDD